MKKMKLLGVLGVSALMMIGAAATAGTSVDKMIDPFVGEHQGKFYSEYTTKDELIAAGSACNLEIAREGMVLLKNKDNMLPLSDVHKVSIFGKNSKSDKWLRGGGGSGVGSNQGEKQVDIEQSLTNVGWEINPTLKSFYSSSASGSGREGTTRYDGVCDLAVGETPVASYTDEVKASFDEYNDAAVVVIVRSGSEGTDLKTMDARDTSKSEPTDKHFLQLSENEEDMLEMVKAKFDKIIILINSGNAFQCDAFEDDAIGAVLWMGTPGSVGAQAIGEILTGAVNPSGHTVDTWTRDHTKNPTYQNFGDNSQTFVGEDGKLIRDSKGEPIPNHTMINADGTPTSTCTEARWVDEDHKVPNRGLNGCYVAAYNNYEEGIYVDYRYYETAYADKLATEGKAKADEWYNGEEGVIYPFGYGLSYTTFTQEIVNFDPAEGTTLTGKKKLVTMDVKVTNTGEKAGKDVVQVYWKAPYTKGGIEKADHVLCAYGKSKMLEKGESDIVTVSFNIQDVADYDYSDANNNGFKGYELDEGEYEVCIMKNAHELIESKKLNVKKGGIQYETDRYTGTKVENQFSDTTGYLGSLPMDNSIGFDHMSRSDFKATFPKHPDIKERTLPSNSKAETFLTHSFVMADLDKLHNGFISEEAYKTKEDIEKLGWEQQVDSLPQASRMQLAEMFGVDFNDPKWDEFLNEFTYSELRKFVEDGTFHNPGMTAIGKENTIDSDGPNQFEIIWWCGSPTTAATFNLALAEEQGKIIGCESFFTNSTCGWLGSAVNMHRSPFGGRNFEYYAADPFLMGRTAGKVIDGASKKGVYCYFKHFAVNDQEKNREGTMTFVDEQALRQLYLKPFQMVVQEGHSRGIMSSYNRLGMVETAANYNLLTNVLRKEWGFQGAVMSDMDHKDNDSFDGTKYENINWRCLAGNNAQLDNNGKTYGNRIECKWDDEAMMAYFEYEGEKVYSYSWYYAVRTCAKEILFAAANCAKVKNNVIGKEVHGAFKASATKININEAAEISFSLIDDAKFGKGDDAKAITEAKNFQIDLEQINHQLPAGMKASEDGSKLVGTPTKRGVYPILVWATITVDGTETEVAQVFDIEVFDASYDLAEDGVEGLPLAAIIGISVGGGVLVIAGAFALVYFLVIKKGKKEAKA